MSEEPQPQRMQQTMPEDGGGWHQVEAGPHLHVMFHPNRQLLGREQDGIERPSIVVAVAGKREQALRFDPFSVGSHYHIRPSVRGRQIPLWVEEGQKPLRDHTPARQAAAPSARLAPPSAARPDATAA
jgi:hypothetical protein